MFRKVFNIRHIHLFFTCTLAAFIPFFTYPVTYAIFWYVVTAVILASMHRRMVSRLRFDAGLTIGILFYLACVAGVFYSSNEASAVFDMQVKLSFFLFPPLMYLLRDFYHKYRHLILWVFVFANILAGFYCLVNAFGHSLDFSGGHLVWDPYLPGVYQDMNTGRPSYFSYAAFSVFRHPAYFSMYLVTCIFILVYFLRNSVFLFKNKKANYTVFALMFGFLLLIIYFLESKAAYLTLILLAMVYIVFYAVRYRKGRIGFIAALVIIVAGVVAFNRNARFYYVGSAVKNSSGLAEAIRQRDYRAMIDTYGIDRIPIWMISGEVISEHLWFGSGSGDVTDRLMDKYKAYNLPSLEANRYNCHNQYLETLIAIGIFGFLFFTSWLLLPLFFRRYYTPGGFLMPVFTGILVVNFMFESVLSTIAGVIYAAFFYSFFYFVMIKSGQSASKMQTEMSITNN